ncbi:MAG: S53 family peptidase [Thaumarchaeota archaeon]|nr:S53 family peptidase [Nitrososphaerota archaeon]
MSAFLLASMFASPAFAAPSPLQSSSRVLHTVSVHSQVSLLDPSVTTQSLVGGLPFCQSGKTSTILCYTPSFLKTAYNFPSTSGEDGLTGKGQTIVIVDAFGSPTIQSDLNTFDSAFGIPAATVTVLCGPTWTGASTDTCPVNTIADLGTAPNAGLCGATGWAEETTLDVTMSHGLAPKAHIVLVVSNDCFDSSIYTAEMAVVNQHQYRGSVMSQSFGEPDNLVTCTLLDLTGTSCIANDPTLLDQPNAVFQTATQRHWTIIASSGDDGANENARVLGTGELVPSFPATSPLVLAAGGTQGSPYGGQYGPLASHSESCAAKATCNTGLVIINGGPNGCGTALRPGAPTSCFPVGYGGEGTWNEFTHGFGLGTSSGGGVSVLYSRPDYQENTPESVTTLLGNTVQVTGRSTPDVSFNSAIHGGFLVPLGFINNPCISSACPGPIWGVFGGTSAASPAWAGIIALLNQANGHPVGFLNPQIYELGASSSEGSHGNGNQVSNQGSGNHDSEKAAPFHDITTGENSDCAGKTCTLLQFTNPPPPGVPSPVFVHLVLDGFSASNGYDMATGWGTPNVAAFIQALAENGN